jgi:GNAT superfamily N-acetyltransferase
LDRTDHDPHAAREQPLSLRQATDADILFSEALSRDNMLRYRQALGIDWDPARYRHSWLEFENLVIEIAGVPVGVLRLSVSPGALEIRDLQLLPAHFGEGIGGWALRQALALARSRGFGALALRVYADNPALRLYTRLGFEVVRRDGVVLHMQRPTELPTPQPG